MNCDIFFFYYYIFILTELTQQMTPLKLNWTCNMILLKLSLFEIT